LTRILKAINAELVLAYSIKVLHIGFGLILSGQSFGAAFDANKLLFSYGNWSWHVVSGLDDSVQYTGLCPDYSPL
tara:strand:- start:38301 stop:38525 length:225 start_codon:yes stop_codon:yes gene_type:complete